jgi:4-amino-4-deoxy-L-arabinose transferase-like glycosyltransferase
VPADHLDAVARRRANRIVLGIAAAAALLRIALVFALHTYEISDADDHWAFGWETGRIARSVAVGNGFADPFIAPSGPTAWVVPGYPLILALLFQLFGVYSGGAALAAFLLNSVLSGLTCVLVYRLAREWFDDRVGVLAAALLAVYPPSIWHAISTIWDTTLFTLCLMALLLLVKRLKGGGPWALATIGSLAGLTVLINPAVVSFYGAALLYLFVTRPEIRRRPFRAAATLAAVPALVIAPWVVRNWYALGFPTLKSNFGLELKIGNNPIAVHCPSAHTLSVHPGNNPHEFARYRRMGEMAYLEQCRREAVAFLAEDPGRGLGLCLRRVQIFWLGVLGPQNDWSGHMKIGFAVSWLKSLSLWVPFAAAAVGLVMALRRRRPVGLLLLTLLVMPLPYYVTHADERYRYPIEPILVILGSYALNCLVARKGRARTEARAAEWVWMAKLSTVAYAPKRGAKRSANEDAERRPPVGNDLPCGPRKALASSGRIGAPAVQEPPGQQHGQKDKDLRNP